MTPETCPQQPPHDIRNWCECGYLDPDVDAPEFWTWEAAMTWAITRAALTGHRMRVEQETALVITAGYPEWVYWTVTPALPDELRAAS